MNVTGRRITNVELCGCFEDLGFSDVAAFLASGNVVFSADGTPSSIEKRIASGLSNALSYDVPTFLRTSAQVRTMARREPFAERGASERGKPQVAMLGKKPSKKSAADALAYESDDDWLRIVGKELHWWPIGGLSDSELNLNAITKILGPMTIRTGNTIVRLAAKFLA